MNIGGLLRICGSGLAALAAAQLAPAADWTQWGGPTRDFIVASTGLADKWPESGPKKLWSRALGPGHSMILCEGDTLYTMYRKDDQEIAIALNRETGETRWETPYDAPAKPDMLMDFCIGPHGTPVIAGDRIFTIGGTVVMNCLDKKSGKILWRHDLMAEYNASHVQRGYGPSPLIYKDYVIVYAGGRDTGVIAFRQADGEVAWKSPPMRPTQCSPILARIHDDDHLIVNSGVERLGLDPSTGDVRWKMQVDAQSAAMMATPLFVPPDRVFLSSAYGGGSYCVQVAKKDGNYEATALYHDTKFKVQHGSMVRSGELIFGSSGDFGPAFVMGFDVKEGKPLWRDRGFAKANFLLADGKLIILDEQGHLALARADEKALTVLSKVKLLEEKAWTAPTLVDSRLYLRDYQTIMALDISKAANP